MIGVEILLGIIILILLFEICYIRCQGDVKLYVDTDKRSKAQLVSMTEHEAVFEIEMTAVNATDVYASLIDAFSKHLLPKEQYDKAKVSTKLENKCFRRDDGYFEALVFTPNSKEELIFTLTLKSEIPISEVLKEVPDIKADVFLYYVGRGNTKIERFPFVISKDELIEVSGDGR